MNKHTLAITRAVGVIGATAALVAGITFANLTSNTATLSNNTLASATASLKVWSGAAWVTSTQGFTFGALVPGEPSVDYPFYLQNDGSGVSLTISAITSDLSGSTIAPSLIDIKITDDSTAGSPSITESLANLSAGQVVLPGDPIAPGAQHNYRLSAKLSSSYGGAGAQSIVPFDLIFTGTQFVPQNN